MIPKILILILTAVPFLVHYRNDYISITSGKGDPNKTHDIILGAIIIIVLSFLSRGVFSLLTWPGFLSDVILAFAWHTLLFDMLIAVKALKKRMDYLGDASITDRWIKKNIPNPNTVFWIRIAIFILSAGVYWWVNF